MSVAVGIDIGAYRHAVAVCHAGEREAPQSENRRRPSCQRGATRRRRFPSSGFAVLAPMYAWFPALAPLSALPKAWSSCLMRPSGMQTRRA